MPKHQALFAVEEGSAGLPGRALKAIRNALIARKYAAKQLCLLIAQRFRSCGTDSGIAFLHHQIERAQRCDFVPGIVRCSANEDTPEAERAAQRLPLDLGA